MVTDSMMEALEILKGKFKSDDAFVGIQAVIDMLGYYDEDVWIMESDEEHDSWIGNFVYE